MSITGNINADFGRGSDPAGGFSPCANADPELAISMITTGRIANVLCFIFSP
jgi:hypothetical protein